MGSHEAGGDGARSGRVGVQVVGEGSEEESEGVRVAAWEAREEAERQRVREHAEEVVRREGGGAAGTKEQGERVGVGGCGGGEREARKCGEELREGARGCEAKNDEAGVGLLDVVQRGAPRQERAEELPRVGGRVGVEGGRAPSGRRRRRRSELHGGGDGDGASRQLACEVVKLLILIMKFNFTAELPNLEYPKWI